LWYDADEKKKMEAICPYIESGGRPFNYQEIEEEETDKPRYVRGVRNMSIIFSFAHYVIFY
jgi:hypothetical protein